MSFVLRVLINGVAIWFATLVLSGLTIVGADSTLEQVGIILLIALVFGIVNAIVKPIVAFLSIPLYILTLGLFSLVVNALMLMLTAWITEQTDWGIRIIGGFWWALLAALIIGVINFAVSAVVPKGKQR